MAADTLDFVQAATAGGATVKTFSLTFDQLEGTRAPTVTDDQTAGYNKGSKWVDKTNKLAYVCVDNSTGAAVWQSLADTDSNDVTLSYSQTSVPGGDTVANTAIESTFADQCIFGANKLVSGDVIRVTARGVYGTKATSPGALRIRVYVKGSAAILLLDTGTFAPTANLTNRGWVCEALLTVQTLGSGGAASAPVEAQGECRFFNGTGTAMLFDMSAGGAGGNTAPITVDLTNHETVYLSAQWQTADPANTITMREFVVEHGAAT